jgi:hypothetical protein
MVNYKNQHYVPEFYFSFFSKDHISIEMYNTRSSEIKRKGYKKLCAESYFYASTPEYELGIHGIENKFFEIIRKIIDGNCIDDKEYIYLLLFVSLQSSRTKREKLRSEYYMDKFIKANIRDKYSKGELWQKGVSYNVFNQLDTFTIKGIGPGSSSTSHMLSMYLSLLGVNLLFDLHPVLLMNYTSKDFIFSDNPIVIYNKYFLNKRRYAATGFASHGLQIFCPLNPRMMLVLYDDNFYNFNEEHNKIIINSDSDVESLNSLQIFNCDENIFFSDSNQGREILELHSELKQFLDEKESEYEWYLIQSSSLKLKIPELSSDGQPMERWIIVPNSNKDCLFIRGPNRNIINYDLVLSFMSIKASPKWDGPCRNRELLEESDKIFDQKMSEMDLD